MDVSSPLKSSTVVIQDDEENAPNQSFIISLITKNQNLSICVAIFLLIMISIIASIIFTQYKANPCAPFARVMIEKTIFGGNSYSVLSNMTLRV